MDLALPGRRDRLVAQLAPQRTLSLKIVRVPAPPALARTLMFDAPLNSGLIPLL